MFPRTYSSAELLHGAVRGEIPADPGKGARLIGHEMAGAISVNGDGFAEVVGLDIRHMERPGGAIALDQGENRVHMTRAVAHLAPRLPANIGHARFKGLPRAAHRGLKQVIVPLHDLADTMGQEPRGFHAALKSPLDLPGAHPRSEERRVGKE